MFEIQKFAISNVYCSPKQDYQLRHKLARVTEYGSDGDVSYVSLYGKNLPLPNKVEKFHVFVVGRAISSNLNFLAKPYNWQRGTWVNAETDMNARNIIIQLYDETGITYPRSKIFYMPDWEGAVVIAVQCDAEFNRCFSIADRPSLRVYSNHYFTTRDFALSGNPVGIRTGSRSVLSNVDKVSLQNEISNLTARGGKAIVYINGFHTNNVTLEIPNNTFVEYVYDASIETKEHYRIGNLRSFISEKDGIMKYLIFRAGDRVGQLLYEDDLEVYINMISPTKTKGLYYYQHLPNALTNVTDKDFALNSQMVVNQATMLVNMEGGSVEDKFITLITRKAGRVRPLIYNSMKLHELYNLPDGKEYEVMLNTTFNIEDYRVETLENSDYFKVASASSIKDITPLLATKAIGYNGITYYYAKNPVVPSGEIARVPYLFMASSLAYAYKDGLLESITESTGPAHVVDPDVELVEFIQGRAAPEENRLYDIGEIIPVRKTEYRVLKAHYNDHNRISVWEDVTGTNSVIIEDDTITVTGVSSEKVRIFYFDRPYLFDHTLVSDYGDIMLALRTIEDRGQGHLTYALDIPYDSIEIFLNKHRLVYGIDWTMDFPYVNIFNKSYLKYGSPNVIHVRGTGFNLDKDKINSREINGFVSHGALTRNGKYDIRSDRVFSAFIGGKLVHNDTIVYSEEDNTVRVDDLINGKPYCLVDRMVSITEISGLPTKPCFDLNEARNERISALYDEIHPEPSIPPFNVIRERHTVFSPLVSRVIHDLKTGAISSGVYMRPYNDFTITELINERYNRLAKLDPVKSDLPPSIVEIHPHYGNDLVDLTLHQYRFVTNLVRIITGGKPELINLSGYLRVNTNTVDIEPPTGPDLGILVVN